ncbi:unnamed protein product [Adineta ricciae]|uniref:Uncharacterized protein n=1 Tax=Adineta ricciae TaxID=249248 RepID=A0A815Z0L8_ADIRI|nr:unnamed protein product [Adineta ricciae]
MCEISSCGGASLATCICCKRNVCREHFIIHDNLLRPKLNDLTGRIDRLAEEFENLSVNTITTDIITKLDQWKVNAHKIIDEYYENKRNEIISSARRLLNQHEKEIQDLRIKIAKMIYIQQSNTHNINLLEEKLRIIQREINQVSVSIHVDIYPLTIPNYMISIDLFNFYRPNLFTFAHPYANIQRYPISSDAIAANNQHFLIQHRSSLYLIDENLSEICRQNWPHDRIRDMCWSKILNCFFILTWDHVYQIDGTNLSIQRIETIEGRSWQSCTCSQTSLYLSRDLWNSTVEEFNLEPSITLFQVHQTTDTKDQKQRIDSLEYQHDRLALAINDETRQEFFIEVRSTISFDRIWIYRLQTDYSERKIQCCIYNHNAWLVADWGSSSLYHLTSDGKTKNVSKYEDEICYIHCFKPNQLIISTKHSFNIHRL